MVFRCMHVGLKAEMLEAEVEAAAETAASIADLNVQKEAELLRLVDDLERQGKIAEAEFEAKAASNATRLGQAQAQHASAVSQAASQAAQVSKSLEAQLEEERARTAELLAELELTSVHPLYPLHPGCCCWNSG